MLITKSDFVIYLFALLALVTSSCLKSKKPGIPPEVLKALDNSGIYKPRLLKVILAFQKPEDSLKLQSAYYLIKNLQHNYSRTISLIDSNDNDVKIKINNFSDYLSIKKHIDSIESTSGVIFTKTDSIILDINNVSSEFLINHINNTFSTKENTPWGSKYEYGEFYNYILPYRIANEKLESYSTHFQKKYEYLINQSEDVDKVALDLSNSINNEILYDNRLEINLNCQNFDTIEKTLTGNLCDINTYKIFALRSIGIAAALDYTPYFSDSVLGYYSTTVILPNKSEIRLTNSDNNTLPYAQGKTAKVYRRTYNNDPKSLFSTKNKKTHTPPFLGNFNYIDVTNSYIETANVTITSPDTVKYVYLAVYNESTWKPIDWAVPEPTGKASFYNMGTDIIYMPVIVSGDSIISVGEQFLLEKK